MAEIDSSPFVLTIDHDRLARYVPTGRPCWRCQGGQMLRIGEELCLQCGAPRRRPEQAVGKPTRGAQV